MGIEKRSRLNKGIREKVGAEYFGRKREVDGLVLQPSKI